MLLKLHRRLQLFVIAFALFNVALCVDYNEIENPNDVEEWANMNLNNDEDVYAENGDIYHTYKSKELAIFSLKSSDHDAKNQLYSCIKFDPATHFCNSSVLKWVKLQRSYRAVTEHDIRKIDLASPIIDGVNSRFLIDIDVYQTPFITFRINDTDYLKIGFIRSNALPPAAYSFLAHQNHEFFFRDRNKFSCGRFLPHKDIPLTGVNAMKTAFYYRYKGENHTTFAYFFVKGPEEVCWYRFHVDGLESRNGEIKINSTGSIKYRSDIYAPHFFTFDHNFGGFASLYWTGNFEDSPQVHFYVFNENQPEKLSFDGGYALNGFDPDVRDDIFKGDYDADAYPAFVSLGKQVFISFTRKGADHDYSALWSGHNGTQHFEVRRPLDDFQTLYRLREDYIAIWEPKKPYENDFVPDPTETTRIFVTTTKSPTTHSTSTSTSTVTTSEAASTSTTSTTFKYSNSTSTANYPDEYDNSNHDSPEDAANADGSQNGNDAKDGCAQSSLLWPLIFVVIFDVIFFIILIILITLSCFGAKKRNAKSSKTKKSKVAPSKTAARIPGTPTTTSKKSIMNVISIKGDTVDDNKKTADTSKNVSIRNKTETVDQGTEFFTMDTTFDHDVEKKGSKK